MNEYLAFYLLLGLPASITFYVLMKAKSRVTFFIVYALWPAWIVFMIVMEFIRLKNAPCGYCGKALPADKAVIVEHVQNCDKNPLVQRVRDLTRRNIDLEGTIADLLRDLNQKNLDVFGGE